jgi:hypothetical protein
MAKPATVTKTITLNEGDLRYLQFMVNQRMLLILGQIQHADAHISEPDMLDHLRDCQRELFTLQHIKRQIGRYNPKTGPAPTRIVVA